MSSVDWVVVAMAALGLTGCVPVVMRSQSASSREEKLSRASVVLVGVVERHKLEPGYLFRGIGPGGDRSENWRVVRRRVRVETVLRGVEKRARIDVYEVYWIGGASGDWNATYDGERAIFPLRQEQGRYRLTQDWTRSIFPVTTGPHARMPLDESRPLGERIALMNWWIERSDREVRIGHPYFHYLDPGGALSQWRRVKLLRGLVRHPSAGVRVPACRELLLLGMGQDECWEVLTAEDRARLRDGGWVCCSTEAVADGRKENRGRGAEWWWGYYRSRESRRLLTAFNDRGMRRTFCRLWNAEYPEDRDNGCPAEGPPPATIVTVEGDVPLVGSWPR